MSGWSCPQEIAGRCQRLRGKPCEPGQRGCLLYGRYRFYSDDEAAPPSGAASGDSDESNPDEPPGKKGRPALDR